MPETISVEILRKCWSHSLFISYFRELFGDKEITLTRTVLSQMKDKGISLPMWFVAQFPNLQPEYVIRTQAINETFGREYDSLQKRNPRVRSGHRDYLAQYRKAREILAPLEEIRDAEHLDVMVEILELPD